MVTGSSRNCHVASSDWSEESHLWRLANVSELRITGEAFERDPEFDLEGYARRSFGTFQEKPVRVVLRFDAAAARDASTFVFHPDQSVETNDDGSVTALTSRWPESIRFVILTPEVQLSTASARTVLPDRISRADAVYNLQRVVLVLQALDTGRRDLLREALRDRWHQPYRQPLVPGLEAALALDHPDLLGICLSGSGPSIVALAEHDVPAVEALLATSYEPLGIPFQIRTLGVHQEAREQGPGATWPGCRPR